MQRVKGIKAPHLPVARNDIRAIETNNTFARLLPSLDCGDSSPLSFLGLRFHSWKPVDWRCRSKKHRGTRKESGNQLPHSTMTAFPGHSESRLARGGLGKPSYTKPPNRYEDELTAAISVLRPPWWRPPYWDAFGRPFDTTREPGRASCLYQTIRPDAASSRPHPPPSR